MKTYFVSLSCPSRFVAHPEKLRPKRTDTECKNTERCTIANWEISLGTVIYRAGHPNNCFIQKITKHTSYTSAAEWAVWGWAYWPFPAFRKSFRYLHPQCLLPQWLVTSRGFGGYARFFPDIASRRMSTNPRVTHGTVKSRQRDWSLWSTTWGFLSMAVFQSWTRHYSVAWVCFNCTRLGTWQPLILQPPWAYGTTPNFQLLSHRTYWAGDFVIAGLNFRPKNHSFDTKILFVLLF